MFRTMSVLLLLVLLLSVSALSRDLELRPQKIDFPSVSAQSIDLPPSPPEVDSVIVYETFEVADGDWTFYDSWAHPPHWQTDDWQPFAGDNSWRCFSPDVGSGIFGGYDDDWLDFMLSPAFSVPMGVDQAYFNFQFRAYLEDGNWDGANVWVFYGNDPENLEFEIIPPATPAYTETSIEALEARFGPGTYPAWAGEGNEQFCDIWTPAWFDLRDYAGYDHVQVAVVFASDRSYNSSDDTDMFGFQVDDLLVVVDGETVWFEDADGGNVGGDPEFLIGGDVVPSMPVTWDIHDNAEFAWSGTHYLGIETIYSDLDQYAEGPAFDMPETGPEREIWLDMMINLDFVYNQAFPDEFFWRPEVWNPVLQEWSAVSSIGNYVYVGGNGGIWEPFSTSGFTHDWDLTYLAGMDGVKLRMFFHSPHDPGYFNHARFDDILIETNESQHDLSVQMTIPYPTTVGVPLYGKVDLSNLGQVTESGFFVIWTLDGANFHTYPDGPYTIQPGETQQLFLDMPDDPYVGYLILDQGDEGYHDISAYHTQGGDENPDNDVANAEIKVSPEGLLEMGVDSRDYYGSLTVTDPNDGPVVHLVPAAINPDVFGGMTFDIETLSMRTNFHAVAGGAPDNTTMTFHVFAGGETPGPELFSGVFDFNVPAGFLGEYMVEYDVAGEPALTGLTGDIWIWAEITEEALNGYYQPFPYRTSPNDFQEYQFYNFDNAVAGDSLIDFGHNLTAVVRESDANEPLSLNLVPIQASVPSAGGNIVYSATCQSNVNQNLHNLTYWEDITGPGGNVVESYRSVRFTLWANSVISVPSVTISVPEWVPDGTYQLEANVGYFPNVVTSDGFSFSKGGVVEDSPTVTSWHHEDVTFATDESSVGPVLPTEYQVGRAAPNPFNPTTSLDIALPESAELTVRVYNVTGQLVSIVASGRYEAGNHTFTVDGSQLASGVYFVRVTVPGQISEMRKIVLMK
jgi:Secretion system C-terminal sorting domain